MVDISLSRLGRPALYVAAGTVTGLVLDWLLARYARRHLSPERQYAGALAAALRGLPTALGVIVGLRLATASLDLSLHALETSTTVLQVIAVLAATVVGARVAGVLVAEWLGRAGSRLPSSTIFVNATRVTVFGVGILAALGTLGISIAPMVTALGVGGLAVGLALQDTLGNLFSGMQILMSRQIEPGDFIRLETGEEGWVHDVTWRNTTIRQATNDLVVVPNVKLGSSLVTNYTTLDAEHIVWVQAGVAYASDLEEVERVTLEVAREVQREVPGAVADHEPILRFSTFGESSVGLRVALRGRTYPDRWLLVHEMIKRLHGRYAAEGIEIPLPQREVHVRSSEAQ